MKRLFYIGASVVVLWIVLVTVLLPIGIRSYLNKAINQQENYEGYIGLVHILSLFRGSFEADDVKLIKKNLKVEAPIFYTKKLQLQINWAALFRGSFSGNVTLIEPKVFLVRGATAGQSQVELDRPWQKVLQDVVKFKINHFTVRKGELHFTTSFTKPPVHVFLRQVDIEARNLTNAPDNPEELFSTIKMSAITVGNGKLNVDVKANPFTMPLPTFRLHLKVEKLALTALNSFFKAYGKFDVEKGQFDFYFEMESNPKTYVGYAKPMLSDVDVLNWKKESQKKNPLRLIWEGIVGTLGVIFKNQPKDTIASKVPFKGSWKTTDVDVYTAVITLIQNAFGKALVHGFEGKQLAK